MKKKIASVLTVLMLFFSVGSYASLKPSWIEMAWEFILSLFDGGSNIPCWSSAKVDDSHYYVDCSSCTRQYGFPDLGDGTCSAN